MERFFEYLSLIDEIYWDYIGFTIIVALGIYFTIKTRGYQFKTLVNAITLDVQSTLLRDMVDYLERIRKGELHNK